MGFGGGKWARSEEVPARVEAMRSLELTDAQVSEIQAILRETHTQIMQAQQQMTQLMYELQSLYWQKNPDQAAIEAKLAELSALRQQIREQQHAAERIQAVLTPEQQETLNAANASMRPPRGPRGGMRKCPPRDGSGSEDPVEPTAAIKGIIR